MTRSHTAVVAALGIITCLALLPGVIYYNSGDRLVHNFYLKCFAEDLWHGVIYPRWCMEATGGLGSPVFMYYFPLPYWVTALFYPLTWMGMDSDELLSLMLWVVTFVTACTCYYWLRTLASRAAAIGGTALYILAPYHAELLLYRVAYAELWFMALLPLFLVRLSACARGRKGEWWKLGIIYGLMVLAHPAGGMIAAFGAGVYLICAWLQAEKSSRAAVFKGAVQAVFGGALGMGLSAIYWLPAQYYKQFAVTRTAELKWPVVDRYPALLTGLTQGFDEANHGTIYIGTAIALLLISAFWSMAWRIWRKEGAEAVTTLTRELVRYLAVGVTALFFYLPILEPLWLRYDLLQTVIFPWRFQLWWVPLLALFAAYFTESHILHIARRRVGDAVVLVAFLVLMSFSMVNYIMPGQDEEVRRVKKMMYLSIYPFAPKWLQTANYLDFKFVMKQMGEPHVLEHAPSTTVEVKEWQAGRIALAVVARTEDTVVLRHLYFPAWEGQITQNGIDSPLLPEPQKDTARMQFNVPAGVSEVRLIYKPYATMWRQLTQKAQ